MKHRVRCLLALGVALLAALPALGEKIPLPPAAKEGIARMYGGDPDGAMVLFRTLEESQPEDPLGYLLEGEARWWKMYCAAYEIKWGMIDAWKRPKAASDNDYLALADKAIHLAEKQLAAKETAEMHLYAGIGLALQARLHGLRDEHRATAHAGVKAREHFLRALQLDPDMADADAGLGLYNYYIDTLSGFVKVLRVFMGIPGGSKKEGIRQLERAMNEGELTAAGARFYLAKNLRTYDHQYEQAITILEPLVEQYPHNPVFLLLLGNLNAELSRSAKATEYIHAAQNAAHAEADCGSCAGCSACGPCAARMKLVAQAMLATLP
jgi:tetratricopeptide (TPR) repeat protein